VTRDGQPKEPSASANHSAKIKIELGGVQETLLFALWCRARESQKERPLLLDPKASEIIRQLDYDFTTMERATADYVVLVSNICCRYCDDAIRRFIADHPKATVVNIGAGLDTTFCRVDNGSLRWYDLDLPEFIDLRLTLLPETDRSRCIPKSAFDFSWFDDIAVPTDGLFMFSHAVLCYLDPAEIRTLFSAIGVRFPGAELIFNSYNAVGRWGGNHLTLRRTGFKDAPLRWSIASATELARWDGGVEVVDSWPIFSRVSRDPSWKRNTVMMMNILHWLRCMSMVHLRLGRSQPSASPRSPRPAGRSADPDLLPSRGVGAARPSVTRLPARTSVGRRRTPDRATPPPIRTQGPRPRCPRPRTTPSRPPRQTARQCHIDKPNRRVNNVYQHKQMSIK
jgi:O-methyltransferase involved in polyketide biosynthesis